MTSRFNPITKNMVLSSVLASALALPFPSQAGESRKSPYHDQALICAKNGDDICQLAISIAYEIGRDFEKDPQKAFYWAKKAADQGNSRAILNVGMMYLYGFGVEVNDEKAIEYIKLAKAKGDAQAQFAHYQLIEIPEETIGC